MSLAKVYIAKQEMMLVFGSYVREFHGIVATYIIGPINTLPVRKIIVKTLYSVREYMI